MPGPTGGMLSAERAGRKATSGMPMSAKIRRNWSSTTSESAPATRSGGTEPEAGRGEKGTSAAKQASSPCVKVVSIPLPE